MPGSPMPWVKQQQFDNNGVPAAGYQLFTYQAGTSTKLATYTDSALTVANTNPIILDSSGRAVIFLTPTSYKFVMAGPTDTDPPASPIWSQDDVPAISPFASNLDMEGVAGEALAVGNFVYLSDGSGGTVAGRWYKTDADQTYSSTAAVIVGAAISAASAAGNFTVRKTGQVTGLAGLVAGTVYYASATAGALTSVAPTNAIVMGKSDTTTSLILGASWADATSTTQGLISTGTQSFVGFKTFTVQPQTFIGTAVTLPGLIGGIYFTDIATHAVVANSTDTVMSSPTIPANMLNANGKSLLISIGSTTASTGANTKTIEIDVGGTQIALRSSATNDASWYSKVFIVRIDSTSVDVLWTFFAAALTPVSGGQRITALDFTTALALRTLGTTGAASTLTQNVCTVEAIG